ncbi:MAG: hypothetical protein ACKPKO_39980, partial [Candidatus Fonsibacter sp.]
MKIEEGAKKFVETGVDNAVMSLASKMQQMTEGEIGNLLKTEMVKMTALELTLMKEEYMSQKHIAKRMDLITMSLFSECRSINSTINQLRDILETTRLTVTQIYDSEFATAFGNNSFATTLGKIIAHKLGAPDEQDDKKAVLHTHYAPKNGHPQNGDVNFNVSITKTGMLTL